MSAAGGTLQMALSLLLVLGAIFALAWLLRRMQGLRTAGGTLLQVQAGIQVGARERVMIVQAGDVHLLLGVAPGRVNLLHRFDVAPQTQETSTPPLPNFKDALRRALGQPPGVA